MSEREDVLNYLNGLLPVHIYSINNFFLSVLMMLSIFLNVSMYRTVT